VIPYAITSRTGTPEYQVQYWSAVLLNVYGAALLCMSPLYGWFADHCRTRQWPYMLGLLFLIGSTLLLALGRRVWILILGRVLQGANASIIAILGLAMVVDTVGPEKCGYIMGYISLAINLGVFTGPLLGGVVFDRAGWSAVWGMIFALLGVDVLLRLVLIEKKRAAYWLKSDADNVVQKGIQEKITEIVPGPSQTASIIDRNIPTLMAESHPRVSGIDGNSVHDVEKGDEIKPRPNTMASLSSSVIKDGSVSGDLAESASPTNVGHLNTKVKKSWQVPVIFYMLKDRRLMNALIGVVVVSTILTSLDSTVPVFVKNTFHWDATAAGLVFLPLTAPGFLDPLIGKFCDRYRPRYLASIGFCCTAPFFILLRIVSQNTIHDKVTLCVLFFILRTAVSLVNVPLLIEITWAVEEFMAKMKAKQDKEQKSGYAQGYAIYNIGFGAGALIGPTMGGLLANVEGWKVSTLALGIVIGVWGILSFWTTPAPASINQEHSSSIHESV